MAIVIDTPIAASEPLGRGHAPHTEIHLVSSEPFLAGVLGQPTRFHYLSRNKLSIAVDASASSGDGAAFEVASVSLGIQALHRCFATHTPFSLSPDFAWYMVVHEVAEYVKQHPDAHADLFTRTPGGKQVISVRDDSLRYDAPSDWERSINLMREPISEMLTDETIELFLPTFSTSSMESSTAILVAFMDTISPYYDFKIITLCGIPQIRLEGTPADWSDLVNRADRLAAQFDGLHDYFRDLIPVLERIADTATGGPERAPEFWRSIYKRSDMSGGPYVTGWITAFFAHVITPDGPKLKSHFDWLAATREPFSGYTTNQFPSHISRVPFVWEYLHTTYDMYFAAGAFGVDQSDGFLSPQLGYAVVEA